VDLNGNVLLSLPTGLGRRIQGMTGSTSGCRNFNANTVTVIRATDSQGNPLASPFVLATLSGNGLNAPNAIAFDGQRILATNQNGNSVSLWRASDLSPLGSFSGAPSPRGACSDGLNFWVTLGTDNSVVRF
jgi:hypothetical protein